MTAAKARVADSARVALCGEEGRIVAPKAEFVEEGPDRERATEVGASGVAVGASAWDGLVYTLWMRG